MSDRIEKTIELKAPVARVWRALTDHREFGTWFRVSLEGPFVPGQVSRGQITYPGYEHVMGGRGAEDGAGEAISPSPGIPTPSIPTEDYSSEPPTLVEFTLEKTAKRHAAHASSSRASTRSRAERRAEAFRMNDGGWTEQMENIAEACRTCAIAHRGAEELRASVFAALGDETRLSVLAKLSHGEPQSIARLTAGTKLSRGRP